MDSASAYETAGSDSENIPPPESEQQRRRRVASRIRNDILGQVAEDLLDMARDGRLGGEWVSATKLNRTLEGRDYWVRHPEILASFLSPDACEEVLDKALRELAESRPDAWVRAGDQYRPASRDWNAYAAAKAETIGRDLPRVQRTAIHSEDGQSVLFGRDDCRTDPRVRRELTILRKLLREAGIPELGFGSSGDGRTWVMVVWSRDSQTLDRVLMKAWRDSTGIRPEPAAAA